MAFFALCEYKLYDYFHRVDYTWLLPKKKNGRRIYQLRFSPIRNHRNRQHNNRKQGFVTLGVFCLTVGLGCYMPRLCYFNCIPVQLPRSVPRNPFLFLSGVVTAIITFINLQVSSWLGRLLYWSVLSYHFCYSSISKASTDPFAWSVRELSRTRGTAWGTPKIPGWAFRKKKKTLKIWHSNF